MSKKPSLDIFLHDVYKLYISIKDDDFSKSFSVFEEVFKSIHEKMKETDSYYERYSSKIQPAGSFYDGVKVGKLNEFDMDIVVRLPLNRNDEGEKGVMIENQQPGFIKMKIGSAFDDLPKQTNWETHHKVTLNWRDKDNYFLQSQFRSWIESTVTKAVNLMNNKVTIENDSYYLTVKKSGPAFTLNVKGGKDFELDVDLVPVIEFRLPRWPKGCRKVESKRDTWFVVPKPLKSIAEPKLQNRCWRLAFHDQEKDMLKGNAHLKLLIRMLKKLRDARNMKAIASYYIKTLFLWEIERKNKEDPKYWSKPQSVLFRDMVEKFMVAMEIKKIPYYWDRGYNLIGDIKPTLLDDYKLKLQDLLNKIDTGDLQAVLKAILTPQEFEDYKKTPNYLLLERTEIDGPNMNPEQTVKRSQSQMIQIGRVPTEKKDSNDVQSVLDKILQTNIRIEKKLCSLETILKKQDEKIEGIEESLKSNNRDFLNKITLLNQELASSKDKIKLLEMDQTCRCDKYEKSDQFTSVQNKDPLNAEIPMAALELEGEVNLLQLH